MRKFIAITIVIAATIALIMGNNYSRGAPDKTYQILYASSSKENVPSKEQDLIKEKIYETFKKEGNILNDFFIKTYACGSIQEISVVALISNQIKIFDLKSEYPGPMYSLLVSGTPIFWFGEETISYIDSCEFEIEGNQIIMKSEA